MTIKILFLSYLIGYLIYFPKIFNYLIKADGSEWLDSYFVTLVLFITAFINLFYPIIWIGVIVNDLVLDPLIASIKNGLSNDIH